MISLPRSDKVINDTNVFVVAELGKNFIQSSEDQSIEKYLTNAMELVDAAVEANVDAVKFQTHVLEDEVLNIDFKSPHFDGSDRFSWVKRNEDATPLHDFLVPLRNYCEEKGVLFFSTPMSKKAAQKLEKIDVPLWKVGSGDIQDLVLADFIISTRKPVIISTGMVSLKELDFVVAYYRRHNIPVIVLYCVSKYPCSEEDFNLGTIEYLREKYPEIIIGFSDHSIDGYEVDLAAIKLGARVIEKHFTLSRNLWGSDHKASVTPVEMKSMIESIRQSEYKNVDESRFYGKKEKELEGANNIHRPFFKKSLVASTSIPKGTKLTKDQIWAMRPMIYMNGVPSQDLPNVLGKRTRKELRKYDAISEDALV